MTEINPPYVGLRPFSRAESGKFFGRERESHETADLWQSCQLTVLHGPHGAGKTSLLEAGVVPLIDRSANDVLPIADLSTGAGPTAGGDSFNPYTFAALSSWAPHLPTNRLASLSLPAFFPKESVREARYEEKIAVLAAIDNFEDLFARPGRSGQEQFIDQLVEALRQNAYLHLLISVTDDRSSVLLGDPRLAGIPKGVIRLDKMAAPAAIRAATRPLESTGVTFAPGVAGMLVQTLQSRPEDGHVEVARLQLACSRLWTSLDPGERVIRTRHVAKCAASATPVTAVVEQTISDAARDHLGTDSDLLRSWLYESFVFDRNLGSVYRGETLTAEMPNEVVDALVDANILTTQTDQYGNRWHALTKGTVAEAVENVLRNTSPVRSSPESYLTAAGTAFRDGNFLLAMTQAKEALHRTEDMKLKGEIQTFLGNVAFSQKLYRTAIKHYQEATTVFEVFGVAPVVGRLLAATGRSRRLQGKDVEAMHDLQSALRRVPGDQSIRTELAWTQWYSGRPENAENTLNEVLGAEKELTAALLARAQILADLGRPEDALRDFEKVLPLRRPSARAAYALALALAGHLAEAKSEMTAVEDSAGGHGPAILRLARIAKLSGDTEAAARLAHQARVARSPALPAHLEPIVLELLG
ncbi:tetratricopeptide repeat protein [Herbidospora sp. NEAU-GS84]|uniref:Tetratricopeptide repeat protein n=1 Tax=Herbidospora solisilvae TaxID=2696284 RepID=A0A7C9P1Y1_9ACTN|nr:tetratricopeptide repeat protein [Herbidospora solisilvae]NAS25437.1 tetratricopeptide repeat protein [Herbidospora solisilvae]